MIGTSERAARLQIRCGAWVFARAINALYRYDPKQFPAPTPGKADNEQIKLALVAYAIGSAALKEKLDILKSNKAPLTHAELGRYFPNWGMSEDGQWTNRPLHYAQTVSTLWRDKADPRHSHGQASMPRGPSPQLSEAGSPLLLLAAMLALRWYFKRRETIAAEDAA
jgi:hypothetical protein